MNNYWHNVGSAQQGSPASNERIQTDETVAPGFYVAEVIDFGAWFNEPNRQWNCKWTLKIVDGVHRDKFLVRWSSMTEERASDNFDLFMNTMGELPVFDPVAGFGDYAAVRHQIQGAVAKVKLDIKTTQNGKRYFNVYIQQLVAAGGPKDPGAPTPSERHLDSMDSLMMEADIANKEARLEGAHSQDAGAPTPSEVTAESLEYYEEVDCPPPVTPGMSVEDTMLPEQHGAFGVPNNDDIPF